MDVALSAEGLRNINQWDASARDAAGRRAMILNGKVHGLDGQTRTLHCGQHYGAAFACECLNDETAAEAWTPNLGQALLEPRLLVEIVPRHTFRLLPGQMMSVSALGFKETILQY
jgi:hypothetical protein